MRSLLIAIIALGLVACDEKPSTTNQSVPLPPQTAPIQNQTQSPSLLEHAATAAIAGAAAGSAGAASHAITNHAIGKFEARRRAKRISRMRSRR